MDDRQELPIESALRHKTTRRSAEDNGAGKTEDNGVRILTFCTSPRTTHSAPTKYKLFTRAPLLPLLCYTRSEQQATLATWRLDT
jgi:hypothetical protein